MQLRRSLVTAASAAALALSLSACGITGFDYATDRVYTPGVGTNERSGDVDVLSATVVSAEAGSGTLIAGFANGSPDQTIALTGIAGAEGVRAASIEEIELAPNEFVNLGDAAEPIVLTGDFKAGDFIELTFTFDSGQETSLEMPVVTNCGPYEGLDASATDVSQTAVADEEHAEDGEDHSGHDHGDASDAAVDQCAYAEPGTPPGGHH